MHERTGVLPVLETDGLAIGSTSGGQDDSEDDETDDRQHLDRAEPELGLAVDAVRFEITNMRISTARRDYSVRDVRRTPIRGN